MQHNQDEYASLRVLEAALKSTLPVLIETSSALADPAWHFLRRLERACNSAKLHAFVDSEEQQKERIFRERQRENSQ